MIAPVSVVIPTYNGAAYLGEALGSVFGQTTPPREVVVVDDASTDGTPELVERIARTAPVRLRLVRLARNSGGPAVPLNLGVAAATSELIAVLDQDDIFAPTKLEDQARLMVGHPELAFACGGSERVGEPGRMLQGPELLEALRAAAEVRDGGWLVAGRVVLRLLVERNNFLSGYPGFLFRRADWIARGGADTRLRISSDYDFLCWLCTRGRVGFVPRIHFGHRFHDANMCNRKVEMYIECAKVRARFLRREPWLRDDPRLAASLGDWFHAMAYWAREAGYYGESLGIYARSAGLWGPDRRTVAAAAKLLPHWAGRRLGLVSVHPFPIR